ncbi:unnamed protein product [Closterium sp. NIES-54]
MRSALTGATTSSARSFIASRYTKQDTSCEAEIYAGAMAAQELRWLTYLLTDLGEPPRSPPVLYVDNKAMLALCREQRLEHRTKHIALRYFLARELQQRGQLRLAYVASEANTADYRPPTAPLWKFDQRAKWGLHLGIEKQYFAWRIMDYRNRLLVPASDCIFYENLKLPVFEQHLASQQNPAMLFHGVRSFANADVELAASEEPDSDGAREAAPDPPVPVTSSGIPEFIPLADAAPEDVREVHHNYLVDEQRRPMPVVSDSSIRVNLDEIGGASEDHTDSVNFVDRTNDNPHYQTGLQILGLAAAVQYSSTVNLEPKTARQALSGPHREKWREAMDRELAALEKRGTWDLIPIEKNGK